MLFSSTPVNFIPVTCVFMAEEQVPVAAGDAVRQIVADGDAERDANPSVAGVSEIVVGGS